MTELAIETRDLIRTYRMKRTTRQGEAVTISALDGITLDVPRGELFGLLGPNGAGKTTLTGVAVGIASIVFGLTEHRARSLGFWTASRLSDKRDPLGRVRNWAA